MKKTITIIALAFAPNFGHAADQAIATVDFKKIYGEYWRSGETRKKIKADESEAKRKIQKHLDEQAKLGKSIQNMQQALKDPKLGAVERNRRERQLAGKIKEYQENAGAIRDFQNATMKGLEMEMRKQNDAIFGEIKGVVAGIARKGRFTLVLDKNTVIFTDGSDDLTMEVIKQLNANDPARSSAPTPGKVPKKK